MDASATAGIAASATYAGFWRRFAGAVIDGIIVLVIEVILTRAIGTSSGSVLAIIAGLAYYGWGWGTGQTVGCMVMGMRMVDAATGEAPGYGRAAIRYLVQFVLGATVILGIIGDLWMIWDPRKQTWQDKAAGTIVVMA
jgi:uncharacterized RDD family membrane protein YckC